jgi:3-hydroxymyristoyl/3-hydroxydecanoyl-(acyl carrier protein) dehydratase
MSEKALFALEDILPILPHRQPFLFVDRVLQLDPFQSIVAERALRPDETFFAGHFPGRPIMPGVLVTEALAQTSGLLLGLSEKLSASQPPNPAKLFYLAATNIKCTFPAVPGDILTLKSAQVAAFNKLFRFRVEATAGRKLIASGSLTLAQMEDTL